jgi:membrane associated rhomboid family serine protease
MLDEFKNAFQRHNNAHVQLIIINVVAFVIMGVLKVFSTILGFESFFVLLHNQFAIPADWNEFILRPWTIITYAFAHDLTGIFHILFNMIALYWFGRLFAEYLGSDKLIAVYILGALAGAVLYLLAYNTIPYFETHKELVIMIGASAAINAIVVGAAVLLPDYTFFLMFFGPVKIKYFAMITVFLSFLGTVGGNEGGNLAHLGGALMGFIYIKQLQAGINWGTWITVTLEWFKGLFSGKPKVKITYRKTESNSSSKAAAKNAKASQEEIDTILDKISDRGYESLTKEEKEKLFNASKK